MRKLILAAATPCLTANVSAEAKPSDAALADLSFLIGEWQAGQGQVADPGGTAKGHSKLELYWAR